MKKLLLVTLLSSNAYALSDNDVKQLSDYYSAAPKAEQAELFNVFMVELKSTLKDRNDNSLPMRVDYMTTLVNTYLVGNSIYSVNDVVLAEATERHGLSTYETVMMINSDEFYEYQQNVLCSDPIPEFAITKLGIEYIYTYRDSTDDTHLGRTTIDTCEAK